MKFIVVILFGCLVLSGADAWSSDTQRAVLVTGASTGIGRNVAETLAEEGFYVYAGARKQADLDALNAIDNITAVRLDVTVPEQIEAAVEMITAEGRGLYGLVNNAGVAIGGPIADVAVDEFEWLMDVNVFGVYRVTQAFMPLIIDSQGHITTISSISGVGSSPFVSHYSASKHAVEAMVDSLAAEMASVGVSVSAIEPGNYNSSITESASARMEAKGYLREESPFAEAFRGFLQRVSASRDRYPTPEDVSAAVLHAMTADEPLRRYMVVPYESEARWAISTAIREVAEYNQWQAFQFSRDELVAMLDDALATRTSAAEALEVRVRNFLANADDRDTHADFWSDTLIYTSSSGERFGKAQILESFDAAPDVVSEPPSYSAADMTVQIHGDSAVVTFKLIGKPPAGSGEVESHYFNTGTFLNRDGRWQAIAWQATRIPADDDA